MAECGKNIEIPPRIIVFLKKTPIICSNTEGPLTTAPKANPVPSTPSFRQFLYAVVPSNCHFLSPWKEVFSQILSSFGNYFCDSLSLFVGAKKRWNFLTTNLRRRTHPIRSKCTSKHALHRGCKALLWASLPVKVAWLLGNLFVWNETGRSCIWISFHALARVNIF